MKSSIAIATNRTVTWRSDWRGGLPFWIAGALLVPLYGVGLLLWIEGYRRWKRNRWTVHDRHLEIKNGASRHLLQLPEMDRARVTRTWLEQRLQLGTLIVESGNRTWRLPAMKGAGRAADTLNQAIQTIAAANRPKPKRPEAPTSPQRMDRMDELTSMWQLGLITDEEFDRERRHFEP